MKKSLVRKVFLLSVITIVVVFLSNIGFTANATYVWKLGHPGAITSPENIASQKFAELVEKKSDGKMVIKLFPASQIGDSIAMIENVSNGSLEITVNSTSWNSQFVRDYNVLTMPFLVRDTEHLKTFLKSSIYQNWKNELSKNYNIHVLTENWLRLPRVLLLKKPINKLADLNGVKLRMPELEVYFESWKAFGAGPIQIPWAECYFSLKQGVIEGMDSPLASVYGSKFYESAPYIIMTNHQVDPVNVLVNEKKLKSLPLKYRKILKEAAQEAGEYYSNTIISEFDKQKEAMIKEGAKFLEIDTTEFIEKAQTIAAKFEAKGLWSKGLFRKISELK